MQELNIQQYNIEPSRAAQIKQVFEPMVKTLEEFEARYNEVVKMSETEINKETCNAARRLRLDIAKVRINTEKARKTEKEEYLRAWKAIDGVANILKFAVVEKEEKLEKIEKHFELEEQKRKEKLAEKRTAELAEFECFNVPGLGEMADEVYSNFITGARSNYLAKKEAEKKAEEERIAKEKAELEERRRMWLENGRLKKEAAEREAKIAEEKRLAEIERHKQEEALKQERAKAEAEKKALEEKARLEREKADAEARRVKAEQDAIIAKERAERAKAETELKAKADAERVEKEKKTAAERKAKRAPDKEKLKLLSDKIKGIELPEVSSEEAEAMIDYVRGMMTQIINTLNLTIESKF
jgi:hypothetical protein